LRPRSTSSALSTTSLPSGSSATSLQFRQTNGSSPSRWSTLEAMSCGKPIVASRDGAIPELIVDGTTGTLVPPGDVGALAKALALYAEHPELRYRHGLAARARAVERFHIEDCARAYLNLFAELATKRSARAPWLGGWTSRGRERVI